MEGVPQMNERELLEAELAQVTEKIKGLQEQINDPEKTPGERDALSRRHAEVLREQSDIISRMAQSR